VLQNNDADMVREMIQLGNCVTPDAID